MCSLIAQLAWSPDGSSVAEPVKTLYANDTGRQDTLNSGLLTKLIPPHQRTTIIIDALDECENYSRLLLWLKAASNDSLGALKFFFSSRTNVKLLNDFPSWEKVELDSKKELTVEDMKVYIRTQVQDRETMGIGRRLLGGEYPELEERLIETLTYRAQGM